MTDAPLPDWDLPLDDAEPDDQDFELPIEPRDYTYTSVPQEPTPDMVRSNDIHWGMR